MILTHSHTEAGGHAVNEDAFELRPHSADPSCLLCALADGQGGRAGGRRAAMLACRACLDAASARPPAALMLGPHVWQVILQSADAAVAEDAEAGFTTVVAFAVHNDMIAGASNGDSGAYALAAGRGVILTERQHKDPPVGSGAARPVGFAARLARPWTVLALSDGVWKYAGWDRVAQAAVQQSGKEILESLRRHAGLPGSGRWQDDFTVVVWHEGIDSEAPSAVPS